MFDLKNPREYFNTRHPVFGQMYCEFIINLLKALEPIRFSFNNIIYDEQEQVSSVILFTTAIFDIGFYINSEKHFVLRFKNFVLEYLLTSKPVVGVGRFTSPDEMVSQIKRGVLDLIGAARPTIADPFLPRKIDEGREDEIRECIGCNICVSSYHAAVPVLFLGTLQSQFFSLANHPHLPLF